MSPARVLFRVDFGVCQRSRGGDAVKLAAYNACTRLSHGGVVYDYRRKMSEHVGGTVLITPEGYPRERFHNIGALWRGAESSEKRGDAQSARQVLLTIPRECPERLRASLVRYVTRPWIEAGMAAQVDLHDPGARDGDAQPHAHILLTMREFQDGGFARTKTQGREWSRSFTAGRGRRMRGQVADRMNAFFTLHALAIAVDSRTNLKVDGVDAMPPEPQISRAAVEAAKRNFEQLPPAVVALDAHRRDRARVIDFDRRIASADERAGQLRRRTDVRPRETNMTNWAQDHGGVDELTPTKLAAATASHRRWSEAQIARGKQAGDVFSLDRYVSYVQEQREETASRRSPVPRDNRDVVFARTTHADREPGFTRRQRFLANLLGEFYDVRDLDPSVAAGIERVSLDREARTATVHLHDGSSFIDRGDRIEFKGRISAPSASEIAAAAGRHGWVQVTLTGTADFKDETAIALALREPPIGHDHTLSTAAAARLAAAIAARAPAGISPVKETENLRDVNFIRPAARLAGDDFARGYSDTDGTGARVHAVAADSSTSADAGTDGGDGSDGVEDASDDEILPRLLAWLAPRADGAKALMAARPVASRGTGKVAVRSQEQLQEFNARDIAVRARLILATHTALSASPPDAALIDAVRRSGDPSAAEDAMRKRQEQGNRHENVAEEEQQASFRP